MVAEKNSSLSTAQRSRIISKVLSPAVRLWLRSQLESAEALQFQIEGGDRQILSGHIPKVTIAASGVVYQGIALSQISAAGEGIRVNLREVMQGKPLRLMDVVPVQAEAKLTEADLNASLQTPLLANALTDLLLTWLQAAISVSRSNRLTDSFIQALRNSSIKLHQPQASLKTNQLVLSGTLVSTEHNDGSFAPVSFVLSTSLQVLDGTKLQLDRPQWLIQPQIEPEIPSTPLQNSDFQSFDFQSFEIDLGSDVNIQQLLLEEGQMICCGSINVLP